MWNDKRFRELSEGARYLWCYLLTGPRTTTYPGIVIATVAVMADDLGWSIDVCRSRWVEIEQRGMALADWSAGVVVLPKALMDSDGQPRASAKPWSPNQFAGWAKSWRDIPECDLKDQYLISLGAFAKALGEGYGKAFAKGWPRLPGCNSKALPEASPKPPEFLPVPVLSLPDRVSGSSPLPPEPPDLGRGGDLEQRLEASLRPPRELVDPTPLRPHELDALGRMPADRGFDPMARSLPPETAMGSSWRRRQDWWAFMRSEHEKLRSARMDPTAQSLAPRIGGQVERDMIQCEKDLASQGYDADGIDAKFRHVICYARDEAIAIQSLRYFVPRLLFEAARFARTADTPISEASRRRGPRIVDVTAESVAEEKRLAEDERAAERRAMAAELEHRERLEGKP